MKQYLFLITLCIVIAGLVCCSRYENKMDDASTTSTLVKDWEADSPPTLIPCTVTKAEPIDNYHTYVYEFTLVDSQGDTENGIAVSGSGILPSPETKFFWGVREIYVPRIGWQTRSVLYYPEEAALMVKNGKAKFGMKFGK